MSAFRTDPRIVCMPLVCLVLCSGCLEIEEKIELRGDGSGTVKLKVTCPTLAVRWLPGEPSAKWIKPWLPETVKLDAFKQSKASVDIIDQQGNKKGVAAVVYETSFSFQEITELNQVRVRPDNRNDVAANGGSPPGQANGRNELSMISPATANPSDIGPFQQIKLNRNDGVLHFRRMIQAARKRSDIQASMMKTPGSNAQPRAYNLGDSHFSISIKCPGKVIEHNAQKADGTTLTWTFKLQDLQEKQDRDWTVEFKCQASN